MQPNEPADLRPTPSETVPPRENFISNPPTPPGSVSVSSMGIDESSSPDLVEVTPVRAQTGGMSVIQPLHGDSIREELAATASPVPTPVTELPPQGFAPQSPPPQASLSIEQDVAPIVPISPPVFTAIDPAVSSLNKKKKTNMLMIGIIIAVVLVTGIGTSAFALWYNTPQKAITDALYNATTARTQISNATIKLSYPSSKITAELKLQGQSDTPNVKGQYDATMHLVYDGKVTDISGAGRVSDKGSVYFKFDGVKKALDQYLESPELKPLIAAPEYAQLKADIVSFVNKVDNKWIRVDEKTVKQVYENYNHDKTSQCFTKAYDNFSGNIGQHDEIYTAYNKKEFLILKNTGSESIAGTDSVRYTASVNAKRYLAAQNALVKTKFGKKLEGCFNTLLSEKQIKQAEESKASEEKYQEESTKSLQKSVDKTKVTLWISRFSHEFTQVKFTSEDKESGSVEGTVQFSFNKNITSPDPQQSVSLNAFQADLDKIGKDYEGLMGQYSTVTTTKTNAGIVSAAVSEYMSNNQGKRPLIEQLNKDYLSSEIIALLSAEAPSASQPERIQYITCSNNTRGFSVYYWDAVTGKVSDYTGDGCGIV